MHGAAQSLLGARVHTRLPLTHLLSCIPRARHGRRQSFSFSRGFNPAPSSRRTGQTNISIRKIHFDTRYKYKYQIQIHFSSLIPEFWDLPWWLSSKEFTCQAGEVGSILRLGRSPGGGNDNPIRYSRLGKSQGQKSLAGCRVTKESTRGSNSRTTTTTDATSGKAAAVSPPVSHP